MLIILTSLVSITTAIRVDWNTNKGPIVPPTTTIRPVPKPPFKEPAPVWENQDDGIINPNMFHYILPQPSKFLNNNYYVRTIASPNDKDQYDDDDDQSNLIFPSDANYNSIKIVPALAVHYVPNVGLKYDAVVQLLAKSYYLDKNEVHDKYHTKLNGKYNYKLKKYKAYEKMKYLPYSKYKQPQQQQQQNNLNQPLSYIEQPYFISNEQPSLYNSQKLDSQNFKDLIRSQKETSTNKAQASKQQWHQSKNSLNDLTLNSKPTR